MMTCSLSWAEWIFLLSSTSDAKFYYENTSLRRNGPIVKMWTLRSGIKNAVDNKIYLSSKDLYGFDCEKEVLKHLSGAAYSGEMGAGEMIFSYTPDENLIKQWDPIIPGTVMETLWKIACDKK
jgi:hypothetical protein